MLSVNCASSNTGYCLPGLVKRSLKGKHKKAVDEVEANVDMIEGRKCFEQVQEICREKVFKDLRIPAKERFVKISEDDKTSEQSELYQDEAELSSIFSNFSALEGRKIDVNIFEPATGKRVKRLRNLRLNTTEKNEARHDVSECQEKLCSRTICQNSDDSCPIAREFSSNTTSKLTRKFNSKKLLELPKVESYEILTPRSILSSETCVVFRKKTVTTSRLDLTKHKRTSRVHSPLNKLTTVFDNIEDNAIEFRNPSPVHGKRLNPKEEAEIIDRTLELVEKNNMSTNRHELPVEEQLPIIKKFVIRLPPIF